MAELFQTTKQNVSLHISNIYEDRELVPQATVKEFLTVRKQGTRDVQRNAEYYNLDMKDWIKKLDGFMQLNEREILAHAGKIPHQLAMDTANKEYEKYSKERQKKAGYKMKIGIYTRVSTEEQAKEGYSLTTQREYLEDYAKRVNREIFKVYSAAASSKPTAPA